MMFDQEKLLNALREHFKKHPLNKLISLDDYNEIEKVGKTHIPNGYEFIFNMRQHRKLYDGAEYLRAILGKNPIRLRDNAVLVTNMDDGSLHLEVVEECKIVYTTKELGDKE